MAAIIYFLVALVIVGMCVSIFWFLKFLASFLSLILASQAAARGTWDVATGGLFSTWRVLKHTGNRNATNALLRSLAFFAASFAFTMGVGFLLSELDSRHCVFNGTLTASDGTVTPVCKASR